MKNVAIYTDGACSGNPGAGGYAAILIYGNNEKVVSGFEPHTTNNRMELKAVISGLSMLKEQCNVTVYTDSAYVANAFNKNWLKSWQINGWKTSTNKQVKNVDLWQDLIRLTNTHVVSLKKVKGHADNAYNNRCDAIAVKEIESNKW